MLGKSWNRRTSSKDYRSRHNNWATIDFDHWRHAWIKFQKFRSGHERQRQLVFQVLQQDASNEEFQQATNHWCHSNVRKCPSHLFGAQRVGFVTQWNQGLGICIGEIRHAMDERLAKWLRHKIDILSRCRRHVSGPLLFLIHCWLWVVLASGLPSKNFRFSWLLQWHKLGFFFGSVVACLLQGNEVVKLVVFVEVLAQVIMVECSSARIWVNVCHNTSQHCLCQVILFNFLATPKNQGQFLDFWCYHTVD